MRFFASIAVLALAFVCINPASIAQDAAPTAAPEAPAETAPAVPGDAALTPSEILKNAQDALAQAGAIQADIKLEVFYPAHYTCRIDLLATQAGDERAQTTTTQNSNTYKSLEVISNGVLWNEQATPVGKVVTRIDIGNVKKSLRKDEGSVFAATPILGTNALFDLTAISHLVDFAELQRLSIDGADIYVLTGGLAARFMQGKAELPAGARPYYERAAVYLGADDFLPRRIELGGQTGKPLIRLDFLSVRKNVPVAADAFVYNPPEDAQVVDATDWALAKLTGE